MTTETRYFKARVRKEHAQGTFADKIFTLETTATGSHHNLMAEAIRLIREQGYETNHIIDHSSQRNCL